MSLSISSLYLRAKIWRHCNVIDIYIINVIIEQSFVNSDIYPQK